MFEYVHVHSIKYFFCRHFLKKNDHKNILPDVIRHRALEMLKE